MADLSGVWESRYSYSGGEGVHQVEVEDYGQTNFIRSLPNEEGSELSMNLSHEDNVLFGEWEEATSPAGEYKGAVLKGLVAFTLDPGGTRAEGIWIGPNRDKTKINSGDWILEKQA